MGDRLPVEQKTGGSIGGSRWVFKGTLKLRADKLILGTQIRFNPLLRSFPWPLVSRLRLGNSQQFCYDVNSTTVRQNSDEFYYRPLGPNFDESGYRPLTVDQARDEVPDCKNSRRPTLRVFGIAFISVDSERVQ